MVCIVAYLQRRKEKQLRGYTNGSSSSRPAYEVVPFLSVARSLGDFWSYNVDHDNFYVSPLPDVTECMIDRTETVSSFWLVTGCRTSLRKNYVHSFRQDKLENGGEERIANSMIANANIP